MFVWCPVRFRFLLKSIAYIDFWVLTITFLCLRNYTFFEIHHQLQYRTRTRIQFSSITSQPKTFLSILAHFVFNVHFFRFFHTANEKLAFSTPKSSSLRSKLFKKNQNDKLFVSYIRGTDLVNFELFLYMRTFSMVKYLTHWKI